MSRDIREIIQEHLGLDPDVSNSDEFIADLDVDSLEVLEMVLMIEDKFDIEIPDEEAEEFKSIDAVIKYMDKIWHA